MRHDVLPMLLFPLPRTTLILRNLLHLLELFAHVSLKTVFKVMVDVRLLQFRKGGGHQQVIVEGGQRKGPRFFLSPATPLIPFGRHHSPTLDHLPQLPDPGNPFSSTFS